MIRQWCTLVFPSLIFLPFFKRKKKFFFSRRCRRRVPKRQRDVESTLQSARWTRVFVGVWVYITKPATQKHKLTERITIMKRSDPIPKNRAQWRSSPLRTSRTGSWARARRLSWRWNWRQLCRQPRPSWTCRGSACCRRCARWQRSVRCRRKRRTDSLHLCWRWKPATWRAGWRS